MIASLEKDKVSIIIPLYNNEKYIINCINSALNQKYKNIEIIIIDDGSTDNGYELVKNKFKNEKIILIKQTNQGPSVARNKGIAYATGKWIVFLDSDDELSENALEIAISNSKDCDLVIGGWNGRYSNKIEYYGPSINKTVIDWQIKDLAMYLLSNGVRFTSRDSCMPSIEGPVAKLYLTKIIKENKVTFPTDLMYAEDVVFNYAYLQFCKKINVISISLYEATRHQDSLSNRKLDLMKVYNLFEKSIINSNFNNWEIEKSLLCRKFVWMITELEKDYKNLTIRSIKDYIANHDLEELKNVDIRNLSSFKKIEYKALTSNYFNLFFVLKVGCFIKKMKNKYS